MACVNCEPCKEGKPCAGSSPHPNAPLRLTNFAGAPNYGADPSITQSAILDIMDKVTSEGIGQINPLDLGAIMQLGGQVNRGEISDEEFLERLVPLLKKVGANRTALELEAKLIQIQKKKLLAYGGMALGVIALIFLGNQLYQRRR